MIEAIFLDTGPLGVLTKIPSKPELSPCQEWLAACLTAGRRVYLPEIADYELRRELVRRGSGNSLAYLNKLPQILTYVPITTEAMQRAAELWAEARKAGKPTSDPQALDGDVILAAQVLTLSPQTPAIVATTNEKHISRFLPCALWQDIQP